MTTEDLLADLLAQESDRRPEADAVLDAVHRRIARQRQVRVTRIAGACGCAVAVAAVTVGVSVLSANSDRGGDRAGVTSSVSTPASGSASAPATASTSATAPATRVSLRPSSGATPAVTPSVAVLGGTRDYSTINAGYLPGPASQDPNGTGNSPGFEERDWDVTVDGVTMDVIIWTESGSLPSRMQATGGGSNYREVTVNGHPGREFISDNITIIAFDLGNGTTAYVGPSVEKTTDTVTTERITAIAVKVADNMQFGRHDPIPGR